jgi:hypothetical protein
VPQDKFESEHVNPLEEHLAAGEFSASLVPFQREIAGSHSRGDIRNGQLPSKPGCFTNSHHAAPRFFCEIARARFAHCATFDDKRQFLVEHVERVIYDHYRVTVIGSLPIKMQLSNSQEIETRKLTFCLRGEIDTTTSHKKPRKKFAEDGRWQAYGAGGRKPPTISLIPVCSVPSLTSEQ